MKIPVDLNLTAFDRDDADRARAWRNDWRVIRWCRQRDVISDVDQDRWYARQSEDPSIKMYSVRLKAGTGDELVGVAGLTSLDWFNRRAEFSLYIDPARQRQGLGRAALQVLLAHAFTNLGLEQVWGEVLDGNPALTLFQSLGFSLDGKRRGWYFKEGVAHDAHLISITREEWHGRTARSTPASQPGDAGRDASTLEATVNPAGRPGSPGKRGRPRGRRGLAAVLPGADNAQDAGGGAGRLGGGAEGAEGAGGDA